MKTRPADKQDKAAYFRQRYASPHNSAYTSSRAEIEQQLTAHERAGAERAFIALTKQALDPLIAEGLALGAVISPCEARPVPQQSASSKPRLSSEAPIQPATVQQTNVVSTPYAISEPASQSEPNPIEEYLECVIPIDLELARLAVAHREFSEYRLWAYGHRFSDGSGRIEKTALFAHLKESGIINSIRTLDDILARGQWLYFTQGYGRSAIGEEVLYIYLTGWGRLAQWLVQRELQEHPERVESNLPGAPRVWLDLSGNLQEAQAQVYTAWIDQKAGNQKFIRISRARLHQLWNRTTKTLLQWEALAGIKTQAVYAENDATHDPLIPSHAYLCLGENGKEFASWRTPNRYQPTQPVKEYRYKGQRRKVRTACRIIIKASMPVENNADGLHTKTGRRYFVKRQTSRRTIPAHKALRQHLRKHQDWDKRHYIHIGKRHHIHIEECSSGNVFRGIQLERNFKGEQTPEFKQRAWLYRNEWKERNA